MATQNVALQEEMRCSLLCGHKGNILILHDKKLRSDIEWVEFDVHALKLSLIHKNGIPQDLGIEIEPGMAIHIKNGTKVQLALMQDKKIIDVKNTTIVIQDY